MKKKISILLLFAFTFYSIVSLNTGCFAIDRQNVYNTVFVTTDPVEAEIVKNLNKIVSDSEMVKSNRITNVGYSELGKSIKIKETVQPELLNEVITEDVNAIYINYSSIDDNALTEYAKNQVEQGKAIYFYGKGIDKSKFANLFNLENSIPKESDAKKELNKNDEQVNEEANIENRELIFIGVEKNEWGYSLITGEDIDYNFYRTIDYLLKDVIHSRSMKDRAYSFQESKLALSTFDLLNNQAFAGSIDDYPIVNYQRKSTAFRSNSWYLITDCYLHRENDSDPNNDYFILETISELNTQNGPFLVSADEFYTKLKPYYSNDVVRSGGPGDQSGTTTISVNFYPPSVSFTYNPGHKIAIDSTLSLSSNYFEAYYKEADLLAGSFPKYTIHRTDLSFKNYAPNSETTFVKTNIYQKAREDLNVYFWAFNPTEYYYNY